LIFNNKKLIKFDTIMKRAMINSLKTKVKRPYSGEAGVQKAVVDYLKYQYPGVLYCASAGGVRTSMKQAIKMKATGYVKGVPDLQIFEPVGNYHGLLIEIKDLKGVVSKEQKQWIKDLNDRGYYATYCKGVESTIKVIDDYFKGQI
jgi:hypothetical protein